MNTEFDYMYMLIFIKEKAKVQEFYAYYNDNNWQKHVHYYGSDPQ